MTKGVERKGQSDAVPSVKLLPCPFCGGVVHPSILMFSGQNLQAVSCRSCGVRMVKGEANNFSYPDLSFVCGEVIAAWNTRAAPTTKPTQQDSGEVVERVARAIEESLTKARISEPGWRYHEIDARAAIAALAGEPDTGGV